jgi:hypothetical protein
MKSYQVTKESYDGKGQVAKLVLDHFSSQEAAQKFINEYVAKRGGNIHKLPNEFGQRGSLEFVVTEVNDFYIQSNDPARNFTTLESVGSAISDFGFIYPLHADGSVDTFDQVDVNDVSDEWTAALSEDDAAIVNKVSFSTKYGILNLRNRS